ncbi:MAG: hypothetical protein GW939_00790 [Candidatus Magasanikbacteria bacterium]|uniref:DUF3784 domain-containing protein n=1 Tax=Candidatus Magasanikbacteria bacterium CG10_big_fil_rev_8_21_14_0_10_38_6 TaxID=1974647 RepID=A0A2M6P1H9_9BACT|nr:hypothetical protein [Candidatus Magasanikbacteria bacterium]NCS71937.1 hypothetical protein [Candidatus Magasanikbacteria bacterium]PIR77409.1 MAG: hypothetical protein COU30_02620 [Candidatus Magasanikbacteria bacterium CG10_big_fil_rev_8_21_14_0_10_38_6]
MKFIIGIIAIAIGILMVIKTEGVLLTFGRINWAEEHLATSGGTRTFYKLLGVLIIILALMGMTGFLGSLILGFFGPLFGGLAQ